MFLVVSFAIESDRGLETKPSFRPIQHLAAAAVVQQEIDSGTNNSPSLANEATGHSELVVNVPSQSPLGEFLRGSKTISLDSQILNTTDSTSTPTDDMDLDMGYNNDTSAALTMGGNSSDFSETAGISETSSEVPSSLPPSFSIEPSMLPSVVPSYSNEPSQADSTSPTLSSTPSLSSSFSPSNIPSDEPSRSAMPSENPSFEPSMLPSKSANPSQIPSSAPSNSMIPTNSMLPSGYPSSTPSSLPSHSPSYVPSMSPSTSSSPSQFPSLAPTISMIPTKSVPPSNNPSSNPSGVPSMAPTLSTMPSLRPSSEPSSRPSSKPSVAPSSRPSSSPTNAPTHEPSYFPTNEPSSSPTQVPSTMPSSRPSAKPSSAPSSTPSASPTLECHDKADYSSPINALKCEDHAGTECAKWRELGLNTEQLGDLINSCPETCAIDCGAFQQYTVSVGFHLSNVPGLLDNLSKQILEKVSVDYMTSFIRDAESLRTFEIDAVELTSQTLLERPQRRLGRRLEQELLRINCEYTGFAIGLSINEITNILVAGVDTEGYSQQLQRSGNAAFAGAEVSQPSDDEAFKIEDTGKSDGSTTATVVVAVLASVSLVFLGIVAFFYRRRAGRWTPQRKHPSSLDSEIGMSSPAGSSMERWGGGTSQGSGSMVSFQQSPADTANRAGHTVLRILSIGTSRSRSDTEEDDSDSPGGILRGAANAMVSPMSDDDIETSMTGEDVIAEEAEVADEEEEHPLSNVVPPMIVFDNIEGQTETGDAARKPQVVPSRRVEASTEFISALNGSKSNILLDPHQFGAPLNLSTFQWTPLQNSDRPLLTFGLVESDDSSDDDNTSIASTPVNSTSTSKKMVHRRIRSSGNIEPIDQSKNRSFLFSPPRMLNLTAAAMPSPTARRRSSPFHGSDWSLGIDDDAIHDVGTPGAKSFNGQVSPVGNTQDNKPSRHHLSIISDDNSSLPPLHATTPESRLEPRRLIQSVWNLSPIGMTRREGSSGLTSKHMRLPSLAKTMGRKKSNSSQQSREDIVGPAESGGDNCSNPDSSERDNSTMRYEFEAPRKGQLGLVIEAPPMTGPIVNAVKDYSPLFGKIMMGDKIVEVDGKKTSRSTLSDVTKFLSVRPGRRGSTVRIIVERSIRPIDSNHDDSNANHSRDNSLTSSSMASSRMIDDETETADDLNASELQQQVLEEHLIASSSSWNNYPK